MSDERKLYLVAMVFFVNSSACHFFFEVPDNAMFGMGTVLRL